MILIERRGMSLFAFIKRWWRQLFRRKACADLLQLQPEPIQMQAIQLQAAEPEPEPEPEPPPPPPSMVTSRPIYRPSKRHSILNPKPEMPAWAWPMTGPDLPGLPRASRKPKPAPAPSTTPKNDHALDGAVHYYLDDLLDELDSYFEEFAILRKADKEAAVFFEKYGANVSSSRVYLGLALDPWWVNNLPARGCIYFGSQRGKDRDKEGFVVEADREPYLPVSFGYFEKTRWPVNVQSSNLPIYRVTVVYHLKGKPYPCQFHMTVAPDGSGCVLRECIPRRQNVGVYRDYWHGTIHSRRFVPLVRMEWMVPERVTDVVKDSNNRTKLNITADRWATQLLAVLASASTMSEMGMVVRVRKLGRVATFAIDMLRSPYFFKDRQKTITVNGRTARILHICRTHERTMAGGEKRFIKTHFRGLRRFIWHGYDVQIGIPGHHFPQLGEFNLASVDEYEMKRLGMKGYDTAVVARYIDALMEKGRGEAQRLLREERET